MMKGIQNSESYFVPNRLPIAIGLIGHRTLNESNLPEIQDQLDSHLLELLSRFPDSPKVIFTALATGADRLIFTSKHRDLFTVIGILPFPVDEYRKDFTSSSEVTNFEDVLEQCDSYRTIDPKSTAQELEDEGRRALAYSVTAQWISENCNILVAVWDGTYNGKTGGTGETVRARLERTNSAFVHIDGLQSSSKELTSCTCRGHISIEDQTKGNLEKIQYLNRALASTPVDSSLDTHFDLLDQAATKLRRRYDRQVKVSLSLGLITADFIAINQSFGRTPWFGLVLLFSTLTFTYWFYLKRSGIKNLYEDLRVVAETLRVTNWKNLAADSTTNPTTSVIGDQGEEWINEVVRSARAWDLLDLNSKERVLQSRSNNWNGTVAWLEEQISYLTGDNAQPGAIKRNSMKAESLDSFAKWSIVLGAILYFSSQLAGWILPNLEQEVADKLFGLAFSISLSFSAYALALSQLMGYKEISSRYLSSMQYLKDGMEQLSNALSVGDFEHASLVVNQVADESLQETYYWYTVRRSRELRPI